MVLGSSDPNSHLISRSLCLKLPWGGTTWSMWALQREQIRRVSFPPPGIGQGHLPLPPRHQLHYRPAPVFLCPKLSETAPVALPLGSQNVEMEEILNLLWMTLTMLRHNPFWCSNKIRFSICNNNLLFFQASSTNICFNTLKNTFQYVQVLQFSFHPFWYECCCIILSPCVLEKMSVRVLLS